MAVPQRRTSKARKNKRRSHHAITAANPALCAHCGQSKPSHRICPHCGYYKGRRVIIVE